MKYDIFKQIRLLGFIFFILVLINISYLRSNNGVNTSTQDDIVDTSMQDNNASRFMINEINDYIDVYQQNLTQDSQHKSKNLNFLYKLCFLVYMLLNSFLVCIIVIYILLVLSFLKIFIESRGIKIRDLIKSIL